jgi:hypothetical protein
MWHYYEPTRESFSSVWLPGLEHRTLRYNELWWVIAQTFPMYQVPAGPNTRQRLRRPKWHPIPNIAHLFQLEHYGPWSKVVHYIENRVPLGTKPNKNTLSHSHMTLIRKYTGWDKESGFEFTEGSAARDIRQAETLPTHVNSIMRSVS